MRSTAHLCSIGGARGNVGDNGCMETHLADNLPFVQCEYACAIEYLGRLPLRLPRYTGICICQREAGITFHSFRADDTAAFL